MAESGKSGDVEYASSTDVVDVTGFTFTETCVTSRRATSDTAGFKKTWAGTRMASGEVRTLFDQSVAAPAIKSGDSITLKLYSNAADYISVPAIINSRSLEVDIDDGAVTAEVLGYESDGAWTETRA